MYIHNLERRKPQI